MLPPVFRDRTRTKAHVESETKRRMVCQSDRDFSPNWMMVPNSPAPAMAQEIDSVMRFLATEHGSSENYQSSTRRSLTEFADWCASAKQITAVNEVTQPI